MTVFDLIMLISATGYLAYVITHTDGPFAVFNTLREQFPLGGLTACVYCLAPWTAAILWLILLTVFWPLVYVLGIAGAALMLTAWTGMKHL